MKHQLTLGCATAFVSLSPFARRPRRRRRRRNPGNRDDARCSRDYDSVRPDADFVKRVVMVPMRDGVKLYTVIVMKKGTAGGPILFSRTPYDAKESAEPYRSQSILDILPAMDAEFVEDNYIRVYQDIRGMHNSEGEFVMTRPIVGPLNSTGIDESTDAYDTIEWLVKNVPESNGKVGVDGQ